MEHLIFFIHIFKFSILFIPIIIISIYRKHNDEKLKRFFNKMQIFSWILFVYSVTDMLVYYDYFITSIEGDMSVLFFDINNVLYYICIVIWLGTQEDILEIPMKRIFKSIYIGFVLSYITMWWGCFFFTEYSTFESISVIFDMVMLLLLITSFFRVIVLVGKEPSEKRMKCILAMLITLFVGIENSSYNMLIIDYSWVMYTLCWSMISIIIVLLVIYKVKHIEIFEEDKADINIAFEKAKVEYGLTDREVAVLREVFSGKNNTQIGEALFISESTVKTHIHNFLNKMNAESRMEAVYKVFKDFLR